MEIIKQSSSYSYILILILIAMTCYHARKTKQRLKAVKNIKEYQADIFSEEKVIEEKRFQNLSN
ncbi:MAG: hypothetical protein ACYDEJ_13885 [Desulfitobacteriaceae bacterium]